MHWLAFGWVFFVTVCKTFSSRLLHLITGCLQKPLNSTNEEIDWTHFTFQHGFRVLPQQSSFNALHVHSANTPPDTNMTHSPEAGTPSNPQLLPVAAKQSPAELALHAVPAVVPVKADPSQQAEHGHAGHAAADFRPAGQLNSFSQQHASDHQPTLSGQAQRGFANSTGPAQEAHQPDSDHAAHAEHAESALHGEQSGELQQGAEEEQGGMQGLDAEGDGEGGSDEEATEAKRITRSRKSNAAELYMLDHGSQLVPKKVSLPSRLVQ